MTITRHHIQGAAWMFWTSVAACGAWVLFFAHHPLPDWSYRFVFISGLAMIFWGLAHALVLAFWLATRPNPTPETK